MAMRRKLLVLCALAGALTGCAKEADNPGNAAGTGAPTAGAIAPMAGTPASGGTGVAGTAPMAGTPASGGMTGAVGGVEAGSMPIGGMMAGTPASGGAGGMTGGAGGEAGNAGMGGGIPTACSAPTPNATVGNACAGTPPPMLKLTMITGGLASPTFVTQAPGDDTRLYVLEQKGTIKIVKDGAVQPTPFLDLAGMINAQGLGFYTEAGLLGMTFDPNFEMTKRFWITYTRTGSYEEVLMEYMMDNPDMVAASSGVEVLHVPQISFNHKGGMLAFGHDGCLYWGLGDGGMEEDPTNTGQGTNDNLSVMLRIDVDNYPTAAPGNIAGDIWSTGHRNPWRFSFDRMTGDMYLGDVGQGPNNGWEEVNVEPKGVPGRNYGWSVAEGKGVCNGDCSTFTEPAIEYSTTDSANSVIGGYVYRGSAIPGMVGRYIWADWTERKLKTFIWSGESDGQPTTCDVFDTNLTASAKVRAFGEDNAGEIYVLTGGSGSGLGGAGLNEAGTLYRIDAM